MRSEPVRVGKFKERPGICAGIIWGAILLFGLLPIGYALLVKLGHPRRQPGSQCRINLNLLKSTCRVYAEKFGEYPPDLRVFFESGFVGEEGMPLVCPIHGNRIRIPPKPSWEQLQRWIDYEYRPPPESARGHVNPDFVIAWDKTPHPDGTRSVITYGSYAGRLSEEEFRKAVEVQP